MVVNGTYVHTLDPFLIRFWGEFGIRWYGLSYLAGFFLGYAIIHWISKRGQILLKTKLVGDFVFTVALGCIVGGRLGYVLFYSPNLLFEFSNQFPFWGVIALNKGGMASHGGMIGIVLACIWFGRKHNLPAPHLFDLTILGATLGIFLGRIANFINGELLGRVCSSDFLLAVKFPQEMYAWSSQELRKLSEIAPFFGVSSESWLSASAFPHSTTVQNVLNNLILRLQSGDRELALLLEPLLAPRYPSQLFAALLEGLLLFLILFVAWRRPRNPGVITSMFFSFYAIVRIFNEQFRLPDAHIGYQLFGLTRGQWLSVGLLLIGIACWWYFATRKTKQLGGWGAAASTP